MLGEQVIHHTTAYTHNTVKDSTLYISVLAQTKAWGITDFSLTVFQQNHIMLKGTASAPLPQKAHLHRFPIPV